MPERLGRCRAVATALAVALLCSSAVAPSRTSTSPTVASQTDASDAPPSGPLASSRVVTVLPTLVPDSVLNRTPTRVVVPRFEIDLPVIEPPPDPDHFPYCNVAEYLPTMSRPGRPGTTYLYAHARSGMFLPILEAAEKGGRRSMVGMRVEVYTSDDRLFTYLVTEVVRHVESLDLAFRATSEQLILQTSEGPVGTPGKTVLIARPDGERAASTVEAQPSARPVRCR